MIWQERMCLGTFGRLARSLATTYSFARVRIIGTKKDRRISAAISKKRFRFSFLIILHSCFILVEYNLVCLVQFSRLV